MIRMHLLRWSAGAVLVSAVSTALAAEATDNRSELRKHAVGGLAAINLYHSFGCVGLVSDGFDGKIYDAAHVQRVMDDVVKTSDLSIEILKSVQRKNPRLTAKLTVEDMIDCYRLVDRDAQLLASAVRSGDKEAMQAFYQAREQTWAKVSEILGIKKQAQKPDSAGASSNDAPSSEDGK